MKKPVRITITGAAGNIGYALAFRIAAGDMLGADQPIILQLLEIPAALDVLRGVVMELRDCAFPLLQDVIVSDDPKVAFRDCQYALLVGSRPRGPGMERKDLLTANGAIFAPQGQALNDYADRAVKVVVVGNPANTNALIAQAHAPDLNPRQFTALTRLDHNRAISQLAAQTGAHSSAIRQMAIWGNHSSTQYPDLSHATVNGQAARDLVTPQWVRETFIPTVQQRGAAIIAARAGKSSAASAASAAIDHMRDWALGAKDWVSMAVPSDGSYGIAAGVIYSFPCRCVDGDYHIIPDLPVDDFSAAKIRASDEELRRERAAIAHLLGE